MTEHLDIPALVAELTLEEKASLCSGQSLWLTQAIGRHGEVLVPSLMLADGSHGLRKPAHPDSVGIGDSLAATCFPTASALGSSWDADLLRLVGAALGTEARAMQVAVVLGPGINIKRSPLCGRNFEYLSEDPAISGILGSALVQGVQSRGVGTSLKHYAVNNQETDRMRISAEVDQRALREIYLAGFERVVTEARPWTVMCSYNRVNGVYASENKWLLTTVLRDEWGYDGVVVSDWGAVDDRVRGLEAGLDLEMPASGGFTDAEIVSAVRSGALPRKVLDRAVARLLLLVNRATAAGHPERGTGPDGRSLDVTAHHLLARQVARDCAVLLKNDAGILPLDPGGSGTLAVIGEFARSPRYQGAGSSKVVPTQVETALEEISALAGPDLTVSFAAGFDPSATDRDEDLRAEAVALARAATTAVVFVGLPATSESEAFDRGHMDLPANQIALIDAVAAVNDRVVVILSNGGAVTVSAWDAHVSAVLEGWLLGQASGGAMADLLFGVASPSGRLAETIPLRLEDTPSYLNFPGEGGQVRYGEGIFVGYRYYDARRMAVSYPFGHGLTYTSFAYEGLTAMVTGTGDDLAVEVEVTVTNTGRRPGHEVVQLYVSDAVSSLQRPCRELKAFTKVALDPGRSRRVTLRLGRRDLSYFHPAVGGWVVEGGAFGLHVGASSRDIRLETTVDVEGDVIDVPVADGSTLGEALAHPVAGPLLREAMASPDAGSLLAAGDDPMMGAMVMAMPLAKLAHFPGSPIGPEALRAVLERVAERHAASGSAGAGERSLTGGGRPG